jgi:hypothetical protein
MRAFLNRPDHLTRAAQELSRMPEVEAAARAVPLPPKVVMTLIFIGAHGQPAMLVTREESARVTRAIDATIQQVRGIDANTTADR